MLQFAAVITTGGFLLFSSALSIDVAVFSSIVNMVNDSKNLEDKLVLQTFQINYLYDAILGLIFIIAWRKQIELEYPSKLLQAMSLEWKAIYPEIIWKQNLILEAPLFQPVWDRAFQHWIDYVNKIGEKKKMVNKFEKKIVKENQKETSQVSPNTSEIETDSREANQDPNSDPNIDLQWEKLSPRERILKKKESKKIKSPKQSPQKDIDEQKGDRIWDSSKYNKKDLDNLDRSKKPRDSSPPVQRSNIKKYVDQKEEKIAGFLDSDEEEVEDQKSNSFLNKWVSKFKNVVGDKKITKQDLVDVLADFKQKLMQKNVAQDVAVQISEAVGVTLLETKTKSFTSVHATVKSAMKEALRKLLTPKRKIDLIVQITKEREKLKPYVIVFVGVNGVGKSTNLAKVAYKLKNAKLSVMLAACDNFRAGAVEQIETHGRNLDIPVFSRGYKEEPANIAYEAIKDATKKRFDAVLVDTAGRMQDNLPLMKELARLVKINKPNLVVFIGEALVGNDAVDQITKFNKALEDESSETFKPQIDAILLSKFDTVDDKVGTALSLVYSTSKPILFVGVGQKYPNLKQLNVNTIVHSLLS